MKKEQQKTKKKNDSVIEHRFRSGALSATIFSREIETDFGKRKVFSINFQKAYPEKDSKGKVTGWKYTNNFNDKDMVRVATLVNSVNTFLFIDEDREEDDDEKEKVSNDDEIDEDEEE